MDDYRVRDLSFTGREFCISPPGTIRKSAVAWRFQNCSIDNSLQSNRARTTLDLRVDP
jgi:hypothetical protein